MAAVTHPQGFLLQQCRLLLLLRLLLQLVVAHGHDGQDQIDQVEAAEEDDEKEEDDMPGSGSTQHSLQCSSARANKVITWYLST